MYKKIVRFISKDCAGCTNLLETFQKIKVKTPIEISDCLMHFDNKSKYMQHGVEGVPVLIMFDSSGNEIKRLIGGDHSVEELENWVNNTN